MESLHDIWVRQTQNENQSSANFQKLNQKQVQDFLMSLETSIAEDLWKSRGGHWSETSIQSFRVHAIKKFCEALKSVPSNRDVTAGDLGSAWVLVVRDFHQNTHASSHQGVEVWGERPLPKKEKKPLTAEQRNSRKLFMYIWAMMQTAIVTKTAIFYFGLKSAEEGTVEGKIYVTLAIMTTVVSLSFFAFRNYKDN